MEIKKERRKEGNPLMSVVKLIEGLILLTSMHIRYKHTCRENSHTNKTETEIIIRKRKEVERMRGRKNKKHTHTHRCTQKQNA